MEPLSPEEAAEEAGPGNPPAKVVFVNEVLGNAIPPSYIPSCEKGFREACNSGHLTGHPVEVGVGVGGWVEECVCVCVCL